MSTAHPYLSVLVTFGDPISSPSLVEDRIRTCTACDPHSIDHPQVYLEDDDVHKQERSFVFKELCFIGN
ncbi:hypothetical protein JVU11DRAFT_12406 [Chiua virens]|nr:hypothetical protein JVU11DRAFT_12406 [Chiua virens]